MSVHDALPSPPSPWLQQLNSDWSSVVLFTEPAAVQLPPPPPPPPRFTLTFPLLHHQNKTLQILPKREGVPLAQVTHSKASAASDEATMDSDV